MDPLLLSIDLGTSNCKAALFNARGSLLEVASHPIQRVTPGPGHMEQLPDQWWAALCATTREIAERHDLSNRLAAVAVTGQMHVVVPVDAGGSVAGPAITLMDRRAQEQCRQLQEGLSLRRLHQITGARLGPYAPLAKLMWLRENDPAVLERATSLLPCKDYLRFRLTGEQGSEPVDAAGTLLYDISNSGWSPEICEAAGIPTRLLPPLLAPTEVAGKLGPQTARATGLPAGVSVAVGAGDDVAFLATGVVSPGHAYEDIGSTASFLACVERPVLAADMSLDLYPHVLPDRWLVGGATSTAGAAVEWVTRLFGKRIEDEQAVSLPLKAHTIEEPSLIFLPYLEGARSPLWDTNARGVFFGLTSSHSEASLTRAVKEGVAFALRDLVEQLRRLGVAIDVIYSTGGAARDADWGRIRATVYGQPTRRATVLHGSCLGSAMLAAVAVGIYPNLEAAVAAMMSPWEEVSPLEAQVDKYQRLYTLYRRLYAALRSLFPEIAGQ